MTSRRFTVLLTGFGPFPGVAVNASARLAAALAKMAPRRMPCVQFFCATLPTEWGRAPSMVPELLERHRPDVVLHFGVSEQACGFVIETVARNACSAAVDACGAVPTTEYLVAGVPREARATIPVDDIVSRLTALQIPAVLSQDAGAYLCNAVFFHTLVRAQRNASANNRAEVAVGFVHVPQNLGLRSCPMTWRQALVGGLEIVNVCCR